MNKEQVFVIVGASLAGAKAGEALRSEGFDGRVLIGEEPHRPYVRPPLSKDYLRGEAEADKLYVHGEASTPSRASGIVIDATGERTRYDRLLVATGAAARRLRFPGAELGGIFYLRYRADADRLRRALATATRVAVVGGGWIGAEVAASVRQMGREVTMIHPDTAPLRASSAPRWPSCTGRCTPTTASSWPWAPPSRASGAARRWKRS
jgi:3-phenylpropionate/trans-cinnamate dioxygenase ferredoxin reductase subunit